MSFSAFGDEELQVLIGHFSSILQRAGVNSEEAELEWTLLKKEVYDEWVHVFKRTNNLYLGCLLFCSTCRIKKDIKNSICEKQITKITKHRQKKIIKNKNIGNKKSSKYMSVILYKLQCIQSYFSSQYLSISQ